MYAWANSENVLSTTGPENILDGKILYLFYSHIISKIDLLKNELLLFFRNKNRYRLENQ